MKCEKHNFHWDIADPMGCPICYGERLAENRIVKLIEEMPWQIYHAVANDGRIIDTVFTPKVLDRGTILTLIKVDGVQEPSVSTNRGQAEFTDKGENR